MNYVCLHNKKDIERFLKKDVFLHLYSIGDLDDFFWPYTIWYGFKSNDLIHAIVLLYIGMSIPTLIAISTETNHMIGLLNAIRYLLPVRFYAHLSPGLAHALAKTYDLTSYGEHYKMALTDKRPASLIDCSDVKQLSKNDLSSVRDLYKISYPGNWFDPRMLETKKYFGLEEKKRLVSVAGIHVYSPQYKVAALGNIATVPEYRNQGYGKRVTAKLCQSLINEGVQVGLNVKADNISAISCYEKLGFKTIVSYEEFHLQRKDRTTNEPIRG